MSSIGCSKVAASLLTSFRPTTSTFFLWQTQTAMSTAGTTIGCGERQGRERARRTFSVKSATALTPTETLDLNGAAMEHLTTPAKRPSGDQGHFQSQRQEP